MSERECFRCNGSGTVIVEKCPGLPSGSRAAGFIVITREAEHCPQCHGTGKLSEPGELRRKIMKQVHADQRKFKRLSPCEQRAVRNELRSVGDWIAQTREYDL